MRIHEVTAPDERSAVAAHILHLLPAWFGIPEATAEYVRTSAELPFWAAYDEDRVVGFIVMNETSPHAAEIHVMGVHPDYHRQGIGHMLFGEALLWARAQGYSFLQVKTLDAAHPDEGYRKTRLFYASLGFKALECFPTLWDERTPCLVMVQSTGE